MALYSDDFIGRLIELESQQMFRGIPVADVERCAHCGGPRRGFAQINDDKVCHTEPPFPDCYRLVTIYGERLGERHPDRVREEFEPVVRRRVAEEIIDLRRSHRDVKGAAGSTKRFQVDRALIDAALRVLGRVHAEDEYPEVWLPEEVA